MRSVGGVETISFRIEMRHFMNEQGQRSFVRQLAATVAVEEVRGTDIGIVGNIAEILAVSIKDVGAGTDCKQIFLGAGETLRRLFGSQNAMVRFGITTQYVYESPRVLRCAKIPGDVVDDDSIIAAPIDLFETRIANQHGCQRAAMFVEPIDNLL